MVKSYLTREQRIKTAGPDVKVLRATSGPERIVKAGAPEGTRPVGLRTPGSRYSCVWGPSEGGPHTFFIVMDGHTYKAGQRSRNMQAGPANASLAIIACSTTLPRERGRTARTSAGPRTQTNECARRLAK